MADLYWELKNFGSFTFDTGYRIYESDSTETPYHYGTAGSTTYTLADHGFVNPNPVVIEPEEEEEMVDDGASALISATAAVLATFLMF